MTDKTHLPNDDSNLRNEVNDKSLVSYLFLWSGQVFSNIGSQIVQFGIIWWITITTQDPLMLGLSAFLGLGSSIVTGLFAGVIVDRYNRKLIIGLVDFLQALTTIVLIYLFVINAATITHILILLTLRGVFQGFHGPALRAIVPIMVPKEKLIQVNSINFFANGIINLIGPVLAALLISFVGIQNLDKILWIDALTFLVALIPLALTRIPSLSKVGKPKDSPFLSEFRQGIGFFNKRKGLLNLLIMYSGINFVLSAFFVLLPLFVVTDYGGNESHLAFALAANQIGGILVSILFTKKTIFKKNTTGIFLGILSALTGMLIASLGALNTDLMVLYVGMIVLGLGIPIANVHSMTIWQTIVPPELQGRVFSVRMMVSQIVSPISLLAAGVLADIFGIMALNIAISVGALILLFYSWFFTQLPNVEKQIDYVRVQPPTSSLAS